MLAGLDAEPLQAVRRTFSLNCAVVCEITICPDQASQFAPHGALPMPGRQGQRVDRVIRQKVLPSVAQRQAPPSKMRPSVSCSPSGSFEASSNAFWSSFVIVNLWREIYQKPLFKSPSKTPSRLTLTSASAAPAVGRRLHAMVGPYISRNIPFHWFTLSVPSHARLD